MGKIKFTLDKKGVRKLLKSPEAMAACKEHADATRNSLGPGYAVTTYTGKTRVNAEVAAFTQKTRQDALENDTIMKALR